MLARDIMTPCPVVVTPDDPIELAADIMRQLNVGAVPVIDDHIHRRLVGILTDRDIIVRCVARRHGSRCRVGDHMTAERLVTADEDADVAAILALMEERRVRRVLIVRDAPAPDEEGDGSGRNGDARDGRRVVGIVALADAALALGAERPLQLARAIRRISEPVLAPPVAARASTRLPVSWRAPAISLIDLRRVTAEN